MYARQGLTLPDRVLIYLHNTRDLGLRYSASERPIYGMSDSDWDVRHSTSGYVFMLCEAAILWASKRQTSVALSSCEAEYACGSNACRDVRYVQMVLNELSQPGIECGAEPGTRVLTDSQSARDVAENPGITARTRHFERWMHHIRWMVQMGYARIQLVKTRAMLMLADVFTKAVGRSQIAEAARVLLNLR